MTPEQDKALTMMRAIINATGATFEDEELAISIMAETLKIRLKPLEWTKYNLFNRAYSQTVCSTITSFGYADVSKNKKGYRAFFENSGKYFDSLEEAKEYIEEAHQENIVQFIE